MSSNLRLLNLSLLKTITLLLIETQSFLFNYPLTDFNPLLWTGSNVVLLMTCRTNDIVEKDIVIEGWNEEWMILQERDTMKTCWDSIYESIMYISWRMSNAFIQRYPNLELLPRQKFLRQKKTFDRTKTYNSQIKF